MSRKSQRTATTTYRRQQLTWDNEESSKANCDYDNHVSLLPETESVSKMTNSRLVTPSPIAFLTHDSIEEQNSARSSSPRRKQLFVEKESSTRNSSGLISSVPKKSDASFAKRLFPKLPTNPRLMRNGDTTISHRNDSSGILPKVRSSHAIATGIASKNTSGRRCRRKLTSGDSLVTLFSTKKALSTMGNSNTCTVFDENRRRKRLRRHTLTKEDILEKKRKRLRTRQNFSLSTSTKTQICNEQMDGKDNENFTGEDNNKNSKDKKQIPTEFLSLLASRKRKEIKGTRARSTLEILDEFKKNRKKLKPRQSTRALLPRTCKTNKKLGLGEVVRDKETEGGPPQENIDNSAENRTTDPVAISKLSPLLSERATGTQQASAGSLPNADAIMRYRETIAAQAMAAQNAAAQNAAAHQMAQAYWHHHHQQQQQQQRMAVAMAIRWGTHYPWGMPPAGMVPQFPSYPPTSIRTFTPPQAQPPTSTMPSPHQTMGRKEIKKKAAKSDKTPALPADFPNIPGALNQGKAEMTPENLHRQSILEAGSEQTDRQPQQKITNYNEEDRTTRPIASQIRDLSKGKECKNGSTMNGSSKENDAEPRQENIDNNEDYQATKHIALEIEDISKDKDCNIGSKVNGNSVVNEISARNSVSPPQSTLKPRIRKLHSSSTFDLNHSSNSANDKKEFETIGLIVKKPQNSIGRNHGISQRTVFNSSLPEDSRRRDISTPSDATSAKESVSDRRITEDIGGNVTLQSDSHQQASKHSKFEQKRHRTQFEHDFDRAKSGSSPIDVIPGGNLSPARGQQSFSRIQNKPLYHRRTHHKKEFSAEEYSLHSRNSNEAMPVQQSESGVAIPSQRLSTNDIYLDESILGMETQQLKSQAYSSSPREQVCVSNEKSRNQGALTGRKQLFGNPCRRQEERQKPIPRQLDNETTTSKKKVRFDSSTTTFSVKIKIKTNLDSNRQNRDGSQSSQSVPLHRSLNESAVQAIASQVTQACLTQARTTAGIGGGKNVCDHDHQDVNVDVDVNDEGESSSHLSESSSNSNQSSGAEEESDRENRKNELHKDMLSERDAPNSLLQRRDIDDGRSVTSELTNDWNRQGFSRYEDQDHFENGVQKDAVLVNRECNARRRFVARGKNDQDAVSGIGKSDCIQNNGNYEDLPMLSSMRPSRRFSKTHRRRSTPSHSSISRRQRMWNSSDSLAGSYIGSIASQTNGDVSCKIPREVSLQKPSMRYTGRHSYRNSFGKTKRVSNDFCGDYDGIKEKKSMSDADGATNNTPVIPVTPTASSKCRFDPSSNIHRCGKCKGCRRTFDCQTCDACLQKLHLYGSSSPSTMKKLTGICISRRCQRTRRVGCMDSLLNVKSSSNQLQLEPHANDKKEYNTTFPADKSLPCRTEAKNSILSTIPKKVHGTYGSVSKSSRPPWDDGDDWTVDYSYLSEPKYRHSWGKIANCTSSNKTTSSTRSLNNPTSWLSANGHQTAARMSVSSVSESVMSQNRSKRMIVPVSLSNNNQAKGKRRNGKTKRHPLHGLALPATSTDACSVTSWRSNRKCLRALMEYDEGDQDWV